MRDDFLRPTIDLEEDVLLAAKEIAQRRGQSMGKVVSDLVREALTVHDDIEERNGVPLFPVQSGATVVTTELVNQLLDELI